MIQPLLRMGRGWNDEETKKEKDCLWQKAVFKQGG